MSLHWGNILCNFLITEKTQFNKQVKSQKRTSILNFLYSPHRLQDWNWNNKQLHSLCNSCMLTNLLCKIKCSILRVCGVSNNIAAKKKTTSFSGKSPNRKWSDTVAGTSLFAEDNLKMSIDNRLWEIHKFHTPLPFLSLMLCEQRYMEVGTIKEERPFDRRGILVSLV